MRWTFVIVAVVLSTGCVWPGTGGTTGGAATTTSGAGGSDAGVNCQEQGCSECISCAFSSTCETVYAACEANPDCQSIDGCFTGCNPGDMTCEQGCYSTNPNGQGDYEAFRNCVYCTACPTACPGVCGT
jgi:hypothetical protein